MTTKFFALIAVFCCFSINNALAQFYSDSGETEVQAAYSEPQAMPKPISLIDNIDEEENTENAEAVEIENYDPSVSFYVQNLNLSPKQLFEAQKISLDTLAKQEELFQKIAELRQQARALEVSSLLAFEAILNDSQRAALQELRANYETSNNIPTNDTNAINAE